MSQTNISQGVCYHYNVKFIYKKKVKSQKILNIKENSKRKFPNQMAKLKAQTHQTKG